MVGKFVNAGRCPLDHYPRDQSIMISRVTAGRMCYADRYESLFVEHVHEESPTIVDFRFEC